MCDPWSLTSRSWLAADGGGLAHHAPQVDAAVHASHSRGVVAESGDRERSPVASMLPSGLNATAVIQSVTGDHVGLTLKLEVSFNGVTPSEGRRPRCLVKALATDAAWPASRSIWLQSDLTSARADDPSIVYVLAEQSEWLDADPASWQQMTMTLHAPPVVGSLMLYCVISDTTDAAGTSKRRFEGQYVDGIRLLVTPSGESP